MLALTGIVIQRRADGVKALGVSDIGKIEQHILRPGELLVAADVVLHDDIPPIELVPHDAVVEAGRLLHQAAGKLRFIHFDIRGHVAVNRRFAGRFAFREAGAVIADDEVGLCFRRGFDQQARGVGVELVIGIDKLQILPRGALDGDVARAGNTAVFLVDDDDALIQTGIHAADFKACVVGAVVDQKHLQILVFLVLDALQTRNHILGGIVNWNDDGNKRVFHDKGSFQSRVLREVPVI